LAAFRKGLKPLKIFVGVYDHALRDVAIGGFPKSVFVISTAGRNLTRTGVGFLVAALLEMTNMA
jgi:hypothetical protein